MLVEDKKIFITSGSNLTIPLDHVKYLIDNGYQCFDNKGLLHNSYGPAHIDTDSEQWWIHGKLHRVDGPALIVNIEPDAINTILNKIVLKINKVFKTSFKVNLSSKGYSWHRYGKKHREDGPAIDFPYKKEYYLEDVQYSYEEWSRRTKLLCFK